MTLAPCSSAASGYGYKGRQGAAEEIEGSLGVLLVDFLRLYGRALNNQEVGAGPCCSCACWVQSGRGAVPMAAGGTAAR